MSECCQLMTIVIPVKNEEKNLPACLENVREFANVVVVDSGSTDRTCEIAAEFGREVVQFKWDGKFPKKRNWLLRNYKFKTPWVMFLDADEVITPAVVEELAAVLPRTEFNAFICYYDNWFMGRMLRHGDAMRKTAILRVGKGEYERIEEDHWSSLDMEIHEHLQVEGQIGEIKARLEHHDKRSLESYYAKHEEYAKWEAGRYAKLMSGSTLEASSLTHRQHLKYRLITKWWFGLAYFFACYILKRGFLDGLPGFIFARGKMRYFRNIRRKIILANTPAAI